MARRKSRHSERALPLEKGFFYSFNVQVQGRDAAISRRVPWNEGFGVLGCKFDDLERFTPLLGMPQVVLHLLAQPALGTGVKGDG